MEVPARPAPANLRGKLLSFPIATMCAICAACAACVTSTTRSPPATPDFATPRTITPALLRLVSSTASLSQHCSACPRRSLHSPPARDSRKAASKIRTSASSKLRTVATVPFWPCPTATTAAGPSARQSPLFSASRAVIRYAFPRTWPHPNPDLASRPGPVCFFSGLG